MFVRVKPSGRYKYLQVVENSREGKKIKQRVLCTLGRLDKLTESGQIDSIAQSLLRFSTTLQVLNLHEQNQLQVLKDVSIGPTLVFELLWNELGIAEVLHKLAAEREHQFDPERAVFLTVLHRLFSPGSDRAAEKWKQDYAIAGTDEIELHHLYRAMGWLGEPVDRGWAKAASATLQQFTKDRIEHRLFERNRDLFTSLEVVFFDTTSIYFEGEGGESIGKHGHSKDFRPDLKQMVVGVVLDADGRPVCCELLPGNVSDPKTLIPVIVRLKQRFAIESFCIVADRGMISAETIETLESPSFRIDYILGCRMRRQKEVRNEVLTARGRFTKVAVKREGSTVPLTLQVKEVTVGGSRYVVCYNPEQAKKDAEDRRAIIASLETKLTQGDKGLVGNKGYRKYLKTTGTDRFAIDYEKLKEEEKFDGTWVLRTNTSYSKEEVALQYKQLWMVEQAFRTVKSVLETRPIYHKCDDTIRGHVFCSFLALMLMKELFSRLELKGEHYEWNDIIRDLTALREISLQLHGRTYYLRTELRGTCFDVLSAARVAVPPRMRQ